MTTDAVRIELVLVDGRRLEGVLGGGDMGRGRKFYGIFRRMDGVPSHIVAYDASGREVARKDAAVPW